MKELLSDILKVGNKYTRMAIIAMCIIYIATHPAILEGSFVYKDLVKIDYDLIMWILIFFLCTHLYHSTRDFFPAEYGTAFSGIFRMTVYYSSKEVRAALTRLSPAQLDSVQHLSFALPGDENWEEARVNDLKVADKRTTNARMVFSNLQKLETNLSLLLAFRKIGGSHDYTIAGFGYVHDHVPRVTDETEPFRSLLIVDPQKSENILSLSTIRKRAQIIFGGHAFLLRVQQISRQAESVADDVNIWFMMQMKLRYSLFSGFYIDPCALFFSCNSNPMRPILTAYSKNADLSTRLDSFSL